MKQRGALLVESSVADTLSGTQDAGKMKAYNHPRLQLFAGKLLSEILQTLRTQGYTHSFLVVSSVMVCPKRLGIIPCAVGPHCLTFLNVVVCIYQLPTLRPSHFLSSTFSNHQYRLMDIENKINH